MKKMSVIHLLRLKHNKSVKEIAEVLNVSIVTYHRIESGAQTTDLNTINKLAELYNVPAEKLFEAARFSAKELDDVI
ncbi:MULTISPECIES: helix-turn-helix transcriptional regulator [Shouchella]|uniref:helix-turn-helix transcriptional regulator n=1 Tax=Shouchella TaxID=2893057 RepID=UPI0002FAE6FB|nr:MULTISPECIES: helix-turn-helix transcriptional regulator [Shouchella]